MPSANPPTLPCLPVSHATVSAAGATSLVTEHYALRGAPICALLNRGFNDSYSVSTDAEERFVLRISGYRARGPADIAWETEFLGYLDSAGVPVAAAVPTRDGTLFVMADLPQGPRAAVLFHYAEGRRPTSMIQTTRMFKA